MAKWRIGPLPARLGTRLSPPRQLLHAHLVRQLSGIRTEGRGALRHPGLRPRRSGLRHPGSVLSLGYPARARHTAPATPGPPALAITDPALRPWAGPLPAGGGRIQSGVLRESGISAVYRPITAIARLLFFQGGKYVRHL